MSTFHKYVVRVCNLVGLLVGRYKVTAAEKVFLEAIGDCSSEQKNGVPVVLIGAVEDHHFLALFASIVSEIRAHKHVDAHQFVQRSLRPGSTRSLYQAVKSAFYYNALTDRKWIRLYAGFCSRVAYRATASLFSRESASDLMQARRICKGLNSKQMLLNLEIAGIKVGDLVYDTFLRFKPAATTDVRSAYLWIVVWQTLRDVRSAQSYFRRAKPRIFLTSYSTYIQHGIAVRVALAEKIKVFSFGNFQDFYKELSSTDCVHTRNPNNYKWDFARLANSSSRIAEAGKALSGRLSGTTDPATSYMRRSAYAGSANLPAGLSGSLVLFLHDFFDSPHCYQWMLFADFWDWATFTLNFARESGIRVFVKPHPNQIVSSESVVRQLMAAYPETIWLSTSTSNVQLAEAGVACAVTVYGTVAHEMAFLGVPSIAGGHNPHISFSFCHTARTRDEYCQLLLNFSSLERSKEGLRRESLEFYCMQNLALSPIEAKLRDAVVQFRRLVAQKGGHITDGEDFLSFLKTICAEPAFKSACNALSLELDDICSESRLEEIEDTIVQ